MPPPASSPGVVQRFVNTLAGKLGGGDKGANPNDRIARLGLSQRQQELNYLWGVYRCSQYATRKIGWDGKEAVERQSVDMISTQGFVPPGFVDNSKSSLPLKFRKPTAPYALVKIIVDRFTGLLFSENRHPEIKVDGDPLTQDWLRTLAEATRLWQQMIQARTYGGSMGTACVGFQYLQGKPIIEVHDPRWCTPQFKEHGSTALESLEIRYMYPKEERDQDTGRWETKNYWFRRAIDEQSDVLFEPALVDEGGQEPDWVEARRADHNFGFCPVVWVQNIPLPEDEDGDGDPDCSVAVYENVEAVDALIAQAHRGILANCDPTIVITSKAAMDGGIAVGSDNAIRVPEGDAKFLELQASGPKAALELASQLREHVLEMASCVLERPDNAVGGSVTATEIQRNYEAMLAKADVLREQYGQKCIIPLLEMVYRAAVMLAKPHLLPQTPQAPALDAQPPGGAQDANQDPNAPPEGSQGLEQGQENPGAGAPGTEAPPEPEGVVTSSQTVTRVRYAVNLPPSYETNQQTGLIEPVERTMGSGGSITLKWPNYFQTSLQDLQFVATATVGALTGGIIDDETAIGFVAPYFKVEDVAGLVDKVRNSAAQKQADMFSMMGTATNANGQPNPPGGGGGEPPAQ